MGVLGHAVLGQSVLGQPEAAAVAALLTWQQIQDHLGVPAGGTQADAIDGERGGAAVRSLLGACGGVIQLVVHGPAEQHILLL